MNHRKPIRRRPTKKKRRTPKKVYEEALARSGGRCEKVENGRRCPFRAEHMHHVIHKGMGGTTSELVHSAENILHLCRYHHSEAHGIREV